MLLLFIAVGLGIGGRMAANRSPAPMAPHRNRPFVGCAPLLGLGAPPRTG